MGLSSVFIIIGGVCILQAMFYKLFYYQCYGICSASRGSYWGNRHGRNTWYEYTVIENGEEKKLVCLGFSFFQLKKGKGFKILVKESNHSKVISYGFYIRYWVIGIFFLSFGLITVILMMIYIY